MSDWRKEVEAFKKTLAPSASRISAEAIRLAFFGTVGGGKSVTAGIFAVGITPAGKIGWVDGEGHRSGWAIDLVAEMAAKFFGGTKESWVARFVVIHVDPPFNPLRVVAATEILEEQGCGTIILDIMSQAWDSDGGYLDAKAEEIERMVESEPTERGKDAKRQRVAASAAAHVKPFTHQKLVNKVNASKCNLVMLFQAKNKFNATTSRPDEFITPIQESGLTRTALAVGRVEAKMVDGQPCGGFCTFRGAIEQGTKFTHPGILACLPKNGEQLTFKHAQDLLAFCTKSLTSVPAPPGGANPTPAAAAASTTSPVVVLQTKLWKMLKDVRTAPQKSGQAVQLDGWLAKNKIIPEGTTFYALDAPALEEAIRKADIVLEEQDQGVIP